tara:strand:- start:6208 stop:7356 length:1149 start_codon:yes stop_codon:yes gene_type:complete
MIEKLINFIRQIYGTSSFIPLHAPILDETDKEYLIKTIESGFVSTAGEYVSEFEDQIKNYLSCNYAISTNSGTSALHISLLLLGASRNTEIITQSLTFVATCNAIRYCNADPVFIDIDKDTLGLSPNSLLKFLESSCEVRDDQKCWNKISNKEIVACVPMHTYGFPVEMDKLNEVCANYNLPIIEDAAESFGSLYRNKSTGTLGKIGTLSFNGNKIITSGAGGMIITNDKNLAKRAKHLTTTAKIDHPWEFIHDEVGYNYRMPNINAALGISQIKKLPKILKNKRKIAIEYKNWGKDNNIKFIDESKASSANFWLNTMIAKDLNERDEILKQTNNLGIMTRPAWKPMHKLDMFRDSHKTQLINTDWAYDRIINLPSSFNDKI